jgi:hypothetical protein
MMDTYVLDMVFVQPAREVLEYLYKNERALVSFGEDYGILFTPSPEDGQHRHQEIKGLIPNNLDAIHRLTVARYDPQRQEIFISPFGRELVREYGPFTQTEPDPGTDSLGAEAAP